MKSNQSFHLNFICILNMNSIHFDEDTIEDGASSSGFD